MFLVKPAFQWHHFHAIPVWLDDLFISKMACSIHCKKRLTIFPSSAGMSPNSPRAGNNLIIPRQGGFGMWHPGWGRKKSLTFFYSVQGVIFQRIEAGLHEPPLAQHAHSRGWGWARGSRGITSVLRKWYRLTTLSITSPVLLYLLE